MRIDTATTDADFADVRDLFRDYDRSLAVDLSSQGFAAEIAVLPGSYAGPAGALLLCRGVGRNRVDHAGPRERRDRVRGDVEALHIERDRP